MTPEDLRRHLDRLGVSDPGLPSADGLFALQRAHLERVPYENIGIQLGRPPGIDPLLSVRRFAAGQGGYCFHLNGGFAALLRALGYDVTLHLGGVHQSPEGRGASGDHLALTVRVGGEEYFVDVGLGDGPYDPLPLRAGTYRQGPFTYRLEPSADEPGGWVFHHDPASSFTHMVFRGEPARMDDFADEHRRLSTAPDSPFLKVLTLLRRDAKGVDLLRGRVLARIDAAGTAERTLDDMDEWFAVVTDLFGRDPSDLDADDRTALWDRVTRAHEAWSASRGEP
ncbi:arylamine N-acetyltransferase [Streptomyces glaucosporus]|uniref:Arylamine N-acetyltransferase n=1 Tax=Streptomyces glaucosporus TaxID=284044 RepID=A0ABP5UX88_9ACTN